ncbi:hypothetical protein ACYJ1Y_02240 [Natrialbaceae archaeon A-gly3]
MARERPSLDDRTTAGDNSVLDRRTYLKLTGGVATMAAVGASSASASADAGEPTDVIEIDYEEYSSPGEVYRQEGGQIHDFSTARAYDGTKSLEIPWEDPDMYRGGRSVFDFNDWSQYDNPHELYQSFYVYFGDDFRMQSGDTLRFFVGGRSTGSGDSGGGSPDGTNGWSYLVGISARDPDYGRNRQDGEYTIFTYNYNVTDGTGYVYRPPCFVEPGNWIHVETYWRNNTLDASGNMNADGVTRLWIDGDLVVDRDNLRFDSTGNQGVDYVGPTGYWYSLQQPWGAPDPTSVYYDNHVLALGGIPDTAGGGSSPHEDDGEETEDDQADDEAASVTTEPPEIDGETVTLNGTVHGVSEYDSLDAWFAYREAGSTGSYTWLAADPYEVSGEASVSRTEELSAGTTYEFYFSIWDGASPEIAGGDHLEVTPEEESGDESEDDGDGEDDEEGDDSSSGGYTVREMSISELFQFLKTTY